jgi:hypothetical protein
MVNSANGALSALASRRSQLGQTVQLAPATLRQAQSTLAALQGAAVPLAPAADGLRAAAPSLTAALQEIPVFANAAVPTLGEVASVSPQLQRLADQSTPVVRALVPLTTELTRYSRQALVPVTTLLADKSGAANLFGEMEGWARSTQGYDASSHIFRFGATISPASFAQLLAMAGVPGPPPLHRGKHSYPGSTAGPIASSPASPPANSLLAQKVGAVVGGVINSTLGTVQKITSGAVSGATQAVGGAGSSTGSQLSSLLGYLLGK